jgi:hypothetical protein
MIKIISLMMLLAANCFASADFGKELTLAPRPQTSGYQFGVSYSYDPGMMGQKFEITWGALIKTTLSQSEISALPAQVKWNAYNLTTKSYLSDWAQAPVIPGQNIFLGSFSAKDHLAKNIIGNQANIILVFADMTGKALYHLDLARLCRNESSQFSNMTDGTKKCDQVSVSDIDKLQKEFCVEAETELLGLVKRSALTCEKASAQYLKKGCGTLACQ